MAYPFKQILVPIDFGDENCLRALAFARDIATITRSPFFEPNCHDHFSQSLYTTTCAELP
jgi:nucleotide-binding universal stress UspA family protein